MAATAQALRLTDSYRVRLKALVRVAEHEARRDFQDFDLAEIDESFGPIRDRVATSIQRAQTEAVRLTAGYVGSFLSTELGEAISPPELKPAEYAGKSFGGLPLAESLESPRIAAKVAIRDEKPDPRGIAERVLLQNVDLDVKGAARAALHDEIAANPNIEGWERAVRGTCAACTGTLERDESGDYMPVHPNCECVAEPRARRMTQPNAKPISREKLAASQQEDLDNYVKGFGPNGVLRPPPPYWEEEFAREMTISRSRQLEIHNLEETIRTHGEAAPTLYRAAKLEDFPDEFIIGDEFADKGFSSCSEDSTVVEDMFGWFEESAETENDGVVEFVIEDANALNVNRYVGFNEYKYQKEWLLQRDTRLAINEVQIESREIEVRGEPKTVPFVTVYLSYLGA